MRRSTRVVGLWAVCFVSPVAAAEWRPTGEGTLLPAGFYAQLDDATDGVAPVDDLLDGLLEEVEGTAGTDAVVEDDMMEDDAFSDAAAALQSQELLRPISAITPDYGFNPNSESDSCRYICPRPEGCEELDGDDVDQFQCPERVALPEAGAGADRVWEMTPFLWSASNMHYHPLYFEDVLLERYGQTLPKVVQPFASVGLFSAQALAWPYTASLDPPCREVYPLGFYRPGECSPKLRRKVPLNGKAAVKAGLFYTGAAFVAP